MPQPQTLAAASTEETMEGVGGLDIFVRTFRPERDPRAVVVIVHGFNSHSGHYLWVAEQMVAAGLVVYALDLRGRGRSDGERYYVDRHADYVDDVARLVALAKSREPGRPVYLLGHSAGGVLSCVYTLDHQEELAGLVCESFAYQVPAPDFALAVVKGISHLAPHAHVLRLEKKDFSRDPAVVQALLDDPLTENEVQPTKTVAEMVRADERLEKEFPRITLPVLILHGTADAVTRPSGSEHFYATAGSTDKTLKLYEGHFHDLLNDLDKETVLADILAWIDQRLPAAKAA